MEISKKIVAFRSGIVLALMVGFSVAAVAAVAPPPYGSGELVDVHFAGQSPERIATCADQGVPGVSPDCTTAGGPDAVVRVRSDAERARMQEFLAGYVRREDVVKSIVQPTGEIVDCVRLEAQPALRRPEMIGHTVQLRPGREAQGLASQESAEQPAPLSAQLYAQGEVCTAGTIPVQRLTMEILDNFETLDAFFRKYPGGVAPSAIEPPMEGSSDLHQYAHAYRYVANWGAESVLNLWSPYTERADEFSLSQIWVVRGSGSDRETVEGGWQKYKDLYGDYNSRLFIYFTPDNYGSGGCYNLSCGKFVQVNSSVYIGGAFSNYSSHGGNQYTIKLLWYKDGANGHWWLKYGDTWVGYYPRSLFDGNGLRDQGAKVDFGGEIINRDISGQHTRTDMGSGYMPGYGWQWAAYQRSIRYVDTSNYYRDATGMTATRTDADCYDISLTSSTGSWGVYFYYGGWGYGSNCE